MNKRTLAMKSVQYTLLIVTVLLCVVSILHDFEIIGPPGCLGVAGITAISAFGISLYRTGKPGAIQADKDLNFTLLILALSVSMAAAVMLGTAGYIGIAIICFAAGMGAVIVLAMKTRESL